MLLGNFVQKKGVYSEILLGKGIFLGDFARKGFCSGSLLRKKRILSQGITSTRAFAQKKEFSGDHASKSGDCAEENRFTPKFGSEKDALRGSGPQIFPFLSSFWCAH